VILDIGETILDNSDYQKRSGESFSNPSWDAWVKEKRAGLLPGAKEFADTVESLHGRVVLVTNRSQGQCPDTEENLRALGMRYDLILCDKVGDAANARLDASCVSRPRCQTRHLRRRSAPFKLGPPCTHAPSWATETQICAPRPWLSASPVRRQSGSRFFVVAELRARILRSTFRNFEET